MSEAELSTNWHQIARRTQTKINVAWCLDRFTPLLVGLSVFCAGLTLYLRSNDKSLSSGTLGSAFALAVTLLAIAAWLSTRRHFIDRADAFVHLEDQLHLHNALTTAQLGVGRWPSLPTAENISSGLDWHWPRIISPLLVSTAVLVAAFIIPISDNQPTALAVASEPRAWQQMEDWLETLEETELIKEPALDEVREKIEQLRAQDRNDWFSHSSMEASDNLRDGLGKKLEQLGAELSHAERGLNAFQNFSEQMNEATKNQLLQEYSQALESLESGTLPLNSKMMQALKNLDPSQLQNLNQLSKEQLDQLREQLKKGAQAACKAGSGQSGGLPALEEGDLIAYLMEQNSKASRQGPGRGGISRGPGEAPITLGEPQHLGTQNFEALQNSDFSRAAPGDLIGLSQNKHDIDKSKSAAQQAGRIKSTGQGGSTIWKESLLPAEKELLKRYFKTP